MILRILRKFFEKLASLVGVPEIHRRLDAAESTLRNSAESTLRNSAALERLLNKQMAELVEDTTRVLLNRIELVSAHTDEVVNEIQQVLTAEMLRHTELVANEVRADFLPVLETLRSDLVRHRRLVDNLNVTSSALPAAGSATTSAESAKPKKAIGDAMYVALEDYFRGTHDTIRERQARYIPIIRQAPLDSGYVLDLGCGRGEWLEVLKANGIVARGIDSNLACVSECQSIGLDAAQADLMAHLRSLSDGECSAITMFQVLEHLPFDLVVNVMREVRRALRTDGIFIAEVPNSENLSVGASTFWIDPTHEKPLFPGLLRFLATETGFAKVDGVYSSPLRDLPMLDGLGDSVAHAITDIHTVIFGPADFALIAQA